MTNPPLRYGWVVGTLARTRGRGGELRDPDHRTQSAHGREIRTHAGHHPAAGL